MSRFARSAPLLALVVGFALAASACGGGGEPRLTKPQYERHVRAVYGEVRAAFAATRGVSGRELAERIDTASLELRIAAQQLDGRWAPPKEVEEHNEELAEGMVAYSEQLVRLVGALRRGDRRALERFNARISTNPVIERMAEAAEEMKFMGYRLGAIAEE